MKLGLGLAPAPDGDPLDSLATRAREAESAGIALGWLDADGDSVNSLLTAAALSAQTTYLRLAAAVRVGGHPLGIAEAASVADNSSNGRLILVLEGTGDDGLLDETAEVLVAAVSSRPFRHDGVRWRIPANLPENDLPQKRVIVTPLFVQSTLPLWLRGPSAAAVARARGLGYVAEGDADGDTATGYWQETEAGLGAPAKRLSRVGAFTLPSAPDGTFDSDQTVAALLHARSQWALDTAILRAPSTLSDMAMGRVIARVATQVAPRVLLDELPDGLAAHWKQVLA
jgi:alkanesulfonate monooxygenase SsuD/methylene tetrahydromethanopterin reductase-like flavin-dependent oxidoreductase (luciferase family)